MKFQRGDLVEVVGKMDGKPWPHARGIVTGFFFGPTTDLVEVTVLQSEIKTMPGRGRLFMETSLQLVEER